MRAEYDSEADVIGILLADVAQLHRGVEVHPRLIVHLAEGEPAQVDVLYPDLGLEEPIAAAVHQFGFDGQALEAAARSALAAPDRAVTVEVAGRAAHA
jgi:hypothetical protein